LANMGTATAIAASRAMLRKKELDFIRVNFLSVGIESAVHQLAQAAQS
jgi:hypothetical protein